LIYQLKMMKITTHHSTSVFTNKKRMVQIRSLYFRRIH